VCGGGHDAFTSGAPLDPHYIEERTGKPWMPSGIPWVLLVAASRVAELDSESVVQSGQERSLEAARRARDRSFTMWMRHCRS